MSQDHEENFRADVYGEDELVPFDVRDYSGRRAMWILLAVVFLLLIAAVTVFKLYQAGVRDRNTPPRIVADTAPYKIAPENPGGEVTPNQDKSVYDVMNGTAKTETVVKAPSSEEPVALPKSATIVVETPKPAASTAQTTPQTAPAQRPAAVAPAPVQSGNSEYVVQVASLRSQADAQRLWTEINRKFSDVLPTGSESDIRRVDLNEKGIYFRLRVAGLANRAAANRLCSQFKARKQSCIVTRG